MAGSHGRAGGKIMTSRGKVATLKNPRQARITTRKTPAEDPPSVNTVASNDVKKRVVKRSGTSTLEPIAYRFLAQLLREQIHRGDYDSAPLPTELFLAKEHKLSRQTVRRAFHDLVAEGLVYRVRGSGTFVTPRENWYARSFGSLDELLQLQLDTYFDLKAPMKLINDPIIAARLGQESAEIYRLVLIRRHQKELIGRTTVYLPDRVGRALQNRPEYSDRKITSRTTMISLLQQVGFDIGKAEQRITAISADKSLATDLGCKSGIPMLRIERLFLDRRGQPTELSVSEYLPEQFEYRTELGRTTTPPQLSGEAPAR